MAYPAEQYQNSPQFTIIKGGENNKPNNLYIILIITVLIGIVIIPFLNSSDEPNGKTTVDSSIDWNNPPCSPQMLSSEWKDVTHRLMKENTADRRFKNERTGKVIEFHPYNSQGKHNPHWHRFNPNRTNNRGKYLDKDGNVVGKGDGDSHIYPNC